MSVVTILITLVVGHLLVSILSYGYYLKNKESTLRLFIVAQVLLCLAYSIIIFRAIYPSITSIIIGNTLLVSALAFQSAVLLMNIGAWNNKIRNIYVIGLTVLMTLFYVYVLFGSKESVRIIIVTFASMSVNLYPMYKLMFEKNSTFFRKLLGITLLTSVLAFLLRIVNSINPAVDMMMLGSNISNVLTFVALYVLMIVNGLGLILVIKENDDEKLLHAATRDSLTGILNSRFLTEACEKQIEMHRRNKIPLVFLMMDLDYFKSINDDYGHNVGDRVLKHFTHTISSGLRTYDLFGRLGGDEFAIFLPNTDYDYGYTIAERLRSDVELSDIDSLKITVSIGIYSLIPDENTDFEGILKAADAALYRIKKSGKNSVGFHNELSIDV